MTGPFEISYFCVTDYLVLQYFQNEMPKQFELDPDAIFNMAFLLKINQKKMKRLEKVNSNEA